MKFPSNPRNGQSVKQFGRKFVYEESTGVWNPVVSSASVAEVRKVETGAKNTFYEFASELPLSNNTVGELAFVQENSRMYVWSGTGWYSIATVTNANATVTGVNSTYNLASDGTPTVITLNASGTSGDPLTWSYVVSSGSIRRTATVTQSDNIFTIVPSQDPRNVGSFKLTFTANDGGNIISHTSEFVLTNQSPIITQSPDAFYQLASDGTPTSIALQATDPENNPITWSYRVVSGSLGATTVTNSANVFTITPSQNSEDEGTFVLEFIASDGAGSDSVTSTFNLILIPTGQIAFTSSGTYNWTVPAGLTSISAVLVGSGNRGADTGGNSKMQGAGGGGLRYVNGLPVTPGETLTIEIDPSPTAGNLGNTGTRLKRGPNILLLAQSGAIYSGGGGTSFGNGPFGGVVGGGNGGSGAGVGNDLPSGGGGAGGYSGNGGNAGASNTEGSSGSGGGGGGGSGSRSTTLGGGGGGGVGLLGEGSSGTGGPLPAASQGGRGGTAGSGGNGGANATTGYGGTGGSYGGGSGGRRYDFNTANSSAGSGAARIIWGPGRAFPSTNTQNM